MPRDEVIPVEVIHNGGQLSVGERLERFEENLHRLADRVDAKANLVDVRSQIQASEDRTAVIVDEIKRDIARNIERLNASESGDTMAAKMFLNRFDAMERSVNDIQRHGSSQAQEAQREISVLEGRVEQLKEENVKYNTLQSSRVNDQVARIRFWTVMIAVMNILIVLANLVIVVVTH